MFLNNVMQCICHNVAAMILLQTGWVAELNLQVSLFNELLYDCSCSHNTVILQSNLIGSQNAVNSVL